MPLPDAWSGSGVVQTPEQPPSKKTTTINTVVVVSPWGDDMTSRSHPLSEAEIENVRPGDKVIKLFDGGGLFLRIAPKGGKCWRYKYRFNGKEKLLSFGTYPKVSLSDARLLHHQAELLIKAGEDPGAVRKESVAESRAQLGAGKSTPSVHVMMDGTFEIWRERAVIRLTLEEARFIKGLMDKLL